MWYFFLWLITPFIFSFLAVLGKIPGIWKIFDGFDRMVIRIPLVSAIFLLFFGVSLWREVHLKNYPYRSAVGFTIGSCATLALLYVLWGILPVHGDGQGEDLSILLLIFLGGLLAVFVVLAWISTFVAWSFRRYTKKN